MRRSLIAATLSAAVLAASLTPASPATAATAFSELTMTPGHFSGSVTTDASYVSFSAYEATYQPAFTWGTPVEVVAGTAAFDFDTLGIPFLRVAVRRCASTDPSSCSTGYVLSGTLPTQQVPANVTWSPDTTLGAGQQAGVTTNDEGNPGTIVAKIFGSTYALPKSGTTTFPAFSNAQRTISIWRCAPAGSPCAPTGESQTYASLTYMWGHVGFPTLIHTSGPNPDTPQLTIYSLYPSFYVAPVDLEWTIKTLGGSVLASGVAEDKTPADGAYSHHLSLPPDLATQEAELYVTIKVDDPDFGNFESPLTPRELFIDNTPPVVTPDLTPLTVFPADDDYYDEITLRAHVSDNRGFSESWGVEIRNSSDQLVFTHTDSYGIAGPKAVTWDGRDDAETPVPAGEYTVTWTVIDYAGNETQVAGGPISVDSRHLVEYTTSIPAVPNKAPLVKSTSHCGKIVTPAVNRNWKGSLGVYGTSSCYSGNVSAAVVRSAKLSLPADFALAQVRVATLGSASLARPGSIAHIYIGSATSTKWLGEEYLDNAFETGYSRWVDYEKAALPDGTIRWRVAVEFRHQYDIKAFTLEATYWMLE